MILIRSSQCSWRTEDEMKHSAIPVGLGKQNSCLNYANVTAFLLKRSDSKSPTKLSSRKWHLRLDWQWNKFFGIKKNKIRSLLWFLIGWFREGLNGKTTFSFGQCLIIKINDHHFKNLFNFYRIFWGINSFCQIWSIFSCFLMSTFCYYVYSFFQ